MQKKPTFFWQGILIILPLLVLVGFGLSSLQQDKILAENEAKERCNALATQVAAKVSEEFFNTYDKLPLRENQWSQPKGRNRVLKFGEFSAIPEESGPHPLCAETIMIDATGNLVSIAGSTNRAKIADIIPHPLPLDELSPEQARLWDTARRTEFAEANIPQAIEAYQKFISLAPPKGFLAAANYDLALLLSKNKNVEAADELFSELATNLEATTESGLPLSVLAQLQRMELAFANPTETSLGLRIFAETNALEHPSIATPLVLTRAAELERKLTWSVHDPGTTWLTIWEEDEAAREFSKHLKPQFMAEKIEPRVFWTEWENKEWLVALRPEVNLSLNIEPPSKEQRRNMGSKSASIPSAKVQATPTGFFEVIPVHENAAKLAALFTLSESRLHLPDYAQFAIEIAGKTFYSPTNNWPVLSSASTGFKFAPQPADAIKVKIYLSNPAVLYADQRQRTIWFAGLILISAMAAMLGFVSAYRGFRQQLRLNEMKSNFVSSVSHELRAPIASVRLLAEGLERGKIAEPQKQKEYFRFIVQECRRLSSLIENVLDFSRIEQNRKNYEFEPTDLVALTEQTVKLIEPYAAERGVKLELQMDSQLSTPNSQLVCDGMAIQQALVNLIDNAIKHSPNGCAVKIGLDSVAAVWDRRTSTEDQRQSQTAVTIQLWVEDSGPGIPSNEHAKIFEQFYRRGSELRRETQGVGIGLTIVKHIAEAHGGRVIVRSAPGAGSRFTIQLPVKNELPAKPAK